MPYLCNGIILKIYSIDKDVEKFFEDAVKIEAWNVAAVQALAVNKKENLGTAIEINHEKTTLNLQHKKEIQKVLLAKYYS